MTSYRVRWEIDMEADNPTEAAACALIVQRDNDPANTATVFDVIAHDELPLAGDWTTLPANYHIDLSQEDTND